jgi:hypothetical protein
MNMENFEVDLVIQIENLILELFSQMKFQEMRMSSIFN